MAGIGCYVGERTKLVLLDRLALKLQRARGRHDSTVSVLA